MIKSIAIGLLLAFPGDSLKVVSNKGGDATVAVAPSITYPATGASLPSPLRVAGTSTAGATISVESDGVEVATTTANGAGVWEATGILLSRATHEIVAIATPGGESASISVTINEVVVPVEGSLLAQALGTRSTLWSRGIVDGVMTPASSGTDPILARFHAIPVRTNPVWTAARLKAIYDVFKAHVGEFAPNVYAQPQAYDAQTDTFAFYNWPDSTKPQPTYITYSNQLYTQVIAFARLAREDATVWTASYLDVIEDLLTSLPRDVDGALTMDPTWGGLTDAGMHDSYMCAYGEAAPVKSAAGTLWLAWAYSEMHSTAVALADSARAATYASDRDAAIAGLRSLRLPSGWYSLSGSDSALRDLTLTAGVAAFGLGTEEEITTSATLVRDAYDAQLTDHDFYRGAIRLLKYDDLFPTATARFSADGDPTAAGLFINGGYWANYGEWGVQAIDRVDPAAAQQLQQEAIDETLRQERVKSGSSPWEYLIDPAVKPDGGGPNGFHGAENTGIGSRLIGTSEALPAYVDLTLNVGNGYDASLDMLHGHLISQVEVISTVSEDDVTVSLYGAAAINTDGEAWPLVPQTFGAESLMAGVQLLSETSEITGVGDVRPAAVFGGRIRAAVTAGAATGTLTVRCYMPQEIEPTFVEVDTIVGTAAALVDDFSTDRLAEYDAAGGGWSVISGQLVLNTLAAGAAANAQWSQQFQDGVVKIEFPWPTLGSDVPVFSLRGRRTDASNIIYVRFPVFAEGAWQFEFHTVVGGADTVVYVPLVTPVAGAVNTASLAIRGTAAAFYVNGRPVRTWTHSVPLAVGSWGILAANPAGLDANATAKVNTLAIVPDAVYDTIQPLPPAHLLEAYDPTLFVRGTDPGRAPRPMIHTDKYVGVMENAIYLRDADGSVVATATLMAPVVRY